MNGKKRRPSIGGQTYGLCLNGRVIVLMNGDMYKLHQHMLLDSQREIAKSWSPHQWEMFLEARKRWAELTEEF